MRFAVAPSLVSIILAFLALTGVADVSMASSEVHKGLYHQHIYISAEASVRINDAAGELAKWLQKMTGQRFEIKTLVAQAAVPQDGIILTTAQSSLVSEKWRHQLNTSNRLESFLLNSINTKQLWIVGRTDMGVSHGVYRYLELLGCRWFNPTKNWTIIPERTTIYLNLNLIQSPAFRARSILYTGGFGGKIALDPREKNKKRWLRWEKRNRWGKDFSLGGHAYDIFNRIHRKELEAHPEYRPQIKGRRIPWAAVNMKLCYSNLKLQKLFAAWVVKTLEANIKRYGKDDPRAQSISVEPSDGLGHCESDECIKLGSISNRVFTLANVAARAVAIKHPNVLVTLYAYSAHAEVPTFDLEPNLFVILCPNGFRTKGGLDNKSFVNSWAQKMGNRNLGMYRYWGLPEWFRGRPKIGIDWLQELPAQIRLWQKLGITSFEDNGTASSGGMGPAYLVLSRLLWDPTLDAQKIMNDFYGKCFGKSQVPMKRMIERWAKSYLSSPSELGRSYRDMKEAYALCKDKSVRKRLDDYVRYLHYLRLYDEFKRLPYSEARKTKALELLKYIWSIYDTGMINSYRLGRLTRYMFAKRVLYDLGDAWNPMKSYYDSDVWATIKRISKKDVERILKDGLETYPVNDK